MKKFNRQTDLYWQVISSEFKTSVRQKNHIVETSFPLGIRKLLCNFLVIPAVSIKGMFAGRFNSWIMRFNTMFG